MTSPNKAEERLPNYDRQCRERCLGVLNHLGPHQTTGYALALAAERRATVERIRAELGSVGAMEGTAELVQRILDEAAR